DKTGVVPVKELDGVLILERAPDKGAIKFSRTMTREPIHVTVTAVRKDGKFCLFSSKDSSKQPAGEILMKGKDLTSYCSGPKTGSSYSGPNLVMSSIQELIVGFHGITSFDGRRA